VAQEIIDDYNTVDTEITELIKTAHFENSNTIVSKMKSLVPEYISMNSTFETLDN
jgi:hypothetical protein